MRSVTYTDREEITMKKIVLHVALLLALVVCIEHSFLFSAPKPKKEVTHERWAIKTSAKNANARVIPFADLIKLKDPPGVTNKDARYDSARIPFFENSLGLREGDIVSVTCWLHLVAAEGDEDYHIQVSNDSANGNHCLVVEVPDPKFAPSTELKTKWKTIREWVKKHLLHDSTLTKEPSGNGNVMTNVPYVTIKGQLFYDDPHVGTQPRGKKNMKAATLWEIHPVTSLDFAPKKKQK